jgi:aryl-alcohol dehydrogenase-like predicted oxidoreductase
LPALKRVQQQGKVRHIGYPQKSFCTVCEQFEVDCVLNYNQFTLQNTRFADKTIPYLKRKGIGVMNAGPFSARLLTDAPLPHWLKEPDKVRSAAREAAALCRRHGADIAQLALQFSVDHPDITTTIAGSANPTNIRQWIRWLKEPIDRGLLEKVQTLFRHVKNVGHIEGLTVNN